MGRNLALVLKIALVGNEDDGEEVLVLDTENLLVKGRDFLKGVARCDRVDEQETFAGAHVLFTHRTKINEEEIGEHENINISFSFHWIFVAKVNKGDTSGESPLLREESMKKANIRDRRAPSTPVPGGGSGEGLIQIVHGVQESGRVGLGSVVSNIFPWQDRDMNSRRE